MSGGLLVLEDTRQQAALPWPTGVEVVRRTLKTGDFSTLALLDIAAIELKRDDFAAAVGSDRDRFDREIERFDAFRFKAIVVADDVLNVYRKTAVHAHAILGSIASWYARHDVPTLFCGNDAGAARVIAGLLKRWEQRVIAEETVRGGVYEPLSAEAL